MSDFHFNIRPASINDAIIIAAIGANCFRNVYKKILPESFLSSIDIKTQAKKVEVQIKAGENILVATDKSYYVVGYTCYRNSKDANYPRESEITSLYITSGFQSRGIGNFLLTEVERRVLATKPISLRIIKGNTGAIDFFESNGYRYVPGRDGSFRGLSPDSCYIKGELK